MESQEIRVSSGSQPQTSRNTEELKHVQLSVVVVK